MNGNRRHLKGLPVKGSRLVHAVFFVALSGISGFSLNAQEYAEIPEVNSPVVIDGIAEELWNNLPSHPITYLIDGTGYPDTSDCSGFFKAFWNRDTLYVLIHAHDNIFYTGSQTVYYNDGFEIYLNVNFTKDTIYTDNCYQFRFIPGSSEITGRWGLDTWTPPTVDFAITVDGSADRTLEAVFPLVKLLGKETPVAEGDSMGFEIEILDNDGSGRNHVLSWNNNEHMAWYNPAMMGTIRFSENTATRVDNLRFAGVNIYPNPVAGRFTISSESAIDEIAIYSLQGKMLDFQKGVSSENVSYDMNHYRTGIYMVMVRLENGRCLNYKICKSNNP